MKNFLLVIITFFTSLPLYAQTQYGYYDDGAVAGGVDRALQGIIIIGGIVVVFVVFCAIIGRKVLKRLYSVSTSYRVSSIKNSIFNVQ